MPLRDLKSFFGSSSRKEKPAEKTAAIEPEKPRLNKGMHRIVHKITNNDEIENISSNLPSINTTSEVGVENDVDPGSYDPSKDNYNAVNDACWKKDENVPLMAICRTFNAIESTSSRLKMISILTNYFHSVIRLSPKDLIPSVYICLNQIGPSYEGKELGIGESSMVNIISEVTGKKSDEIKKVMGHYPDLGVVAEKFKTNQNTMLKHSPLYVGDLFLKLKEIGSMTGQSSSSHKKSKILGLVVASKGIETRYLVRSLLKKLRIGLAEQSMLVSIAHAFVYSTLPLNQGAPSKEDLDIASLTVKTSFCELPNYDIIIESLLSPSGLKDLHLKCKMRPGVPVKPMLAVSSKSVTDVFKRFEHDEIACEYKYDGERAQIHVDSQENVSIFSRNQENSTEKFPDVVKLVLEMPKTKSSFILDCEVVAWDSVNSKILPFQMLSTRKRKNVSSTSIKVQVCVFAFDLLYLNGEPLVRETFRNRRRLLYENFNEIAGRFHFASHSDVSATDDIQTILEESIKANCEGLVIKTLDNSATYEIAKRSHNWRKLKKDYLDSVGDSFDLVVIGAYVGVGKRSGTYGGYLLACYDPDEEEYQSICKIGTGFSDEDLKKQFDSFSKLVIDRPKSNYRYPESLKPYHWFDNKVVWQVRAADISLSPIHRAAFGKVEAEKGISLRFPRFEKERPDKNPEQATDIYQVIDMYKNQEKNVQLSQVNTPESNSE